MRLWKTVMRETIDVSEAEKWIEGWLSRIGLGVGRAIAPDTVGTTAQRESGSKTVRAKNPPASRLDVVCRSYVAVVWLRDYAEGKETEHEVPPDRMMDADGDADLVVGDAFLETVNSRDFSSWSDLSHAFCDALTVAATRNRRHRKLSETMLHRVFFVFVSVAIRFAFVVFGIVSMFWLAVLNAFPIKANTDKVTQGEHLHVAPAVFV